MLDLHGQPDYLINMKLRHDRAVNELIGLARGMIADGVVTDSEAHELRTWARRNPDLCISFPGADLYERLLSTYEDGRVDPDERQELLWFLQQLAGEPELSDDPEAGGATTLPLTRPAPRISHEGSRFVVTGRFLCGTRKEVLRRLETRGAQVHPSVTLDTSYLLIGCMASRDWKHGSFGTKIQKAVELRERGYPIAIVAEDHWAAHLRASV